jgi:hypothetical protein
VLIHKNKGNGSQQRPDLKNFVAAPQAWIVHFKNPADHKCLVK